VADVKEIFRLLSMSNICVSIGWEYANGIDYKIGTPDMKYLTDSPVASTGTLDMSEAAEKIADHASATFPDSRFSGWWRGCRQ
jgi:hypothetical protein